MGIVERADVLMRHNRRMPSILLYPETSLATLLAEVRELAAQRAELRFNELRLAGCVVVEGPQEVVDEAAALPGVGRTAENRRYTI